MRRQSVMALVLLAPWCLGIDWPGAAHGLAAEMSTAAPTRRIAILEQAAESRSAEAEALVVRALTDDEPSVRLAAAGLSGRYRIHASLPTLTTWLSDARPETRAAAAEALGALEDPEPLAALVRALGDADVTVRLRAVSALAAIGSPDGTIPLLGRVTDTESSVRLAAAAALGQMGDPRAVLSLLGALQDPIPDVRQAAALALGRLHDPRALRGLQSLLHDANGDVRVTATRAIASLGGSTAQSAVADLAALALREDPNTDVSAARAAVEALGRIGGEAACDVLVQVFRSDSGDPGLTDAAAAQLLQMRALTALRIEALTAAPFPSRMLPKLLTLLGGVGGDGAAGAILSLLSSPLVTPYFDLGLRSLGRTGSSRALMPLLALCGATQAPSPTRRAPSPGSPLTPLPGSPVADAAALDGLRLLSEARGELDGRAFDPLMDALQGRSATDPQRVAAVATVLGYTRSSRAPGALASLLDAPNERVRATAAEALLRAGITGVEARVVAALSDPSPAVRASAAEALARHGRSEARDAILARWASARPTDRTGMTRALGRIAGRAPSPAATALLIEIADHAAAPLAATALDALSDVAAHGDPAARNALIAATASVNLGPSAMQSLGNAFATAPPDQRPALQSPLLMGVTADDVWSRATATWALGRAGESAIPTLIHALNDSHNAVATNAAGALARIFEDRSINASIARDGLCGVLQTRTHPVLRANALWAVARGRIRCDEAAIRRMLLVSRSPWERAAAAEAIRSMLSQEPQDSRRFNQLRVSLEQCADEDTERWVAVRCAEPVTSPTAPTEQAWSEVDAAIVDEAGDPSPRATYGLALPDGLIRVGQTGADSWVHERHAPVGRFMVIDP